MADNAVFVVKAVVGTGVVGALQETVHLVLVEIDHADVAFVVFVVDIVSAGLAVCSFFVLHIISFRKSKFSFAKFGFS